MQQKYMLAIIDHYWKAERVGEAKWAHALAGSLSVQMKAEGSVGLRPTVPEVGIKNEDNNIIFE